MARGITVVAGAAGCGKTTHLVSRYRQVAAAGPVGAALWLAPTHRAVVAVGGRVLADRPGAGCLVPNLMTFDQWARATIAASSLVVRPLGALAQRELLREIIGEAVRAGKLSYFEPIAATPGFLHLVVRFIQELKRLEIWPDELAAAGAARASQKQRELGHLYRQYQALLTAHQLYDAQGRFWSARALIRDGQTRPFERVRHVFVDGFTDFTRTEHEVLEILAGRAETVTISLPLEGERPREQARSDLFSKVETTLGQLRRRHDSVTLVEMPQRDSDWPAGDHLERYLFGNPSHVPPPAATTGIEIVGAAGARGEIEMLARRIKTLLARGDTARRTAVQPAEVLVVFRSVAEVAPLVRDVFGEYGVPVSVESAPALARSPALMALTAMLKLDVEDWPRESLLTVLMHNCFRPSWPEWREGRAARTAEWLVRYLQLPAGRQALLERVERLAARVDDADASPRQQRVARDAHEALPLLQRIAVMLDRLPRRATPRDWSGVLAELAETSGLLKPQPAGAAWDDASLDDSAAWLQWREALEALERLDVWLAREPRKLDKRELADFLAEVLHREPAAGTHDETGRVRVLSAESARHVRVPYLFVAGLSEKSFPPSDSDDCLVSESESRALAAAGLPLVSRADRVGYEMLLFYEVVTRATRQLTLSYAALDRAAQPLAASPYVTEVERAFQPRHLTRHDVPLLSCVPGEDNDLLSARELRVRAVADAREGDATLVAQMHRHGATADYAANVVAGLGASCSRQQSQFGPYEGMLNSRAAASALNERFGKEHCWSASRLEQYGSCPFQFYLEQVLDLRPQEDPVLSTDYLGRGRMLHALLSALHRELNERGGSRSPADQEQEQFSEQVRRLVSEFLEAIPGLAPLPESLATIDARRVETWLARYPEQHAGYDAHGRDWDAPPVPAHFEVAFGPRHGDDLETAGPVDPHDPVSVRNPYELVCGEEVVRFSGRIDRIDIGMIGGQTVFNIIDYKSGTSKRTKPKAVEEGMALQLPLYALAAGKLLGEGEAVPLRAAYWHVAAGGYTTAIEFHTHAGGRLSESPAWTSLQRRLRERVRALVDGVRQGQFPVHSADDQCTSRCAYSTVCRVNQVRSLGKSWSPPGEAAP